MPAALFSDGPSSGLGVAIISATAAAIKRMLEASTRFVISTSTALTITQTQHANKVILWRPNSSGAATATLPLATATGDRYRIINDLAQTQGSLVLTARTGDVVRGKAKSFDTTAAADASAFLSTATSIKLTLNRTTQGGLGYDEIIADDTTLNSWLIDAETVGSGTLATPFSA